MQTASKNQVKFTTGLPYNERVFYQPLYYLAENYRQMTKQNSGKEINSSKLDKDLIILGQPKLEICSFTKNSGKDIHITLSLDKFDNTFEFTYKGVLFKYDVAEYRNIGDRMTKICDDILIYSEYSISFDSQYQQEFEDLIKTCIMYFDLHFNGDKEDKDKISIYLNSNDGGFLQYLGKRHKRDMASIYLPKKQKAEIITDMAKFLDPSTRAKYLRLGINHKRVYLLEGIPGTGKTSLITALASKFNFNIAIISFVPKMSDVDLLKILRNINDTYEERSHLNNELNNKKTLIVFEDIDCIFKERKSNDEARNGITFSGLLNALDGITSNENLICFITTNFKSHLDSALLRPGRIDYIMRFDYSKKEQIQDMFCDFTTCQDADKIQEFHKACSGLQIKISTALLQQYLMQYLDMPDDAISNVEKMKTMFDNAKIDKEVDETNLYS